MRGNRRGNERGKQKLSRPDPSPGPTGFTVCCVSETPVTSFSAPGHSSLPPGPGRGSGKQRALETCKTASLGPVPQKPRVPRKTRNGRRNLGVETSSQLRRVNWEKVIWGWPKSSFRILHCGKTQTNFSANPLMEACGSVLACQPRTDSNSVLWGFY